MHIVLVNNKAGTITKKDFCDDTLQKSFGK